MLKANAKLYSGVPSYQENYISILRNSKKYFLDLDGRLRYPKQKYFKIFIP